MKVLIEMKYYVKKKIRKTPPMPIQWAKGKKTASKRIWFTDKTKNWDIRITISFSGARPSDKATFSMMHMMAFNAFKKKLLPFCFDSNGKFNYEFITPELVENCEEFEYSYFENLPFANITEEEIIEMKTKYNGIPIIAWGLIRYWTKDIRQCSENVCRRRDYIV